MSDAAAAPAPVNGVPPRACQWILSYLPTADPTASSRASLVPIYGLDALQLKDLKKLSSRINDLCAAAVRNGDYKTVPSTNRWVKPRSGARKADMIASIRRCFYADPLCRVAAPSNDAIWALLGVQQSRGTRSNGTSAVTTTAATNVSASRSRSASTSHSAAGSRQVAASSSWSMAAPMPRTTSASVGVGGAVGYAYTSYMPSSYVGGLAPGFSFGARSATLLAPGQQFAAPPPPQPAPKSKSKKRPAPSKPVEPDYVDMTLPRDKWGPPKTTGALAEAVRIKKEKHTTSSATSATVGAACSRADDGEYYYDSTPRDMREMSLVGQMKAMGFTDQREILAGLRHVEKKKREVGAVSGMGGGGMTTMLDSATHVEEAMMWIVAQREESDEARKMDLVRITSEQHDRSEEERRRKDIDRRLEEASLEDIVGVDGSTDGGGYAKHSRSKFFHFSILLRSPMVRSIFLSISTPKAKRELIRLLKLEQKASQWYGSVLPWAYFTYVAAGRIESWAEDVAGTKPSSDPSDVSAQDVAALIHNEACTLERALFVLSEQHDNGLQNVPKIFIKAREDAMKKGLPDGPEGQATGDKSSDSDDEVVIVTERKAEGSKKDVDSPDKEPAAVSTGTLQNCSSSSSSAKKTTPHESEVIEIF